MENSVHRKMYPSLSVQSDFTGMMGSQKEAWKRGCICGEANGDSCTVDVLLFSGL